MTNEFEKRVKVITHGWRQDMINTPPIFGCIERCARIHLTELDAKDSQITQLKGQLAAMEVAKGELQVKLLEMSSQVNVEVEKFNREHVAILKQLRNAGEQAAILSAGYEAMRGQFTNLANAAAAFQANAWYGGTARALLTSELEASKKFLTTPTI